MDSTIFGTLFIVYFCSLVPGSADDDVPKWLEPILSAPRARSHHKHQHNTALNEGQKLLEDILTHDDELNLLLQRYKASQRRSWIIDDPGNRATDITSSTATTPPETPPPPPTTTPTTQTTATTAATTQTSPSRPSRPRWWPSRWSWSWGKRRRRSSASYDDIEEEDEDDED